MAHAYVLKFAHGTNFLLSATTLFPRAFCSGNTPQFFCLFMLRWTKRALCEGSECCVFQVLDLLEDACEGLLDTIQTSQAQDELSGVKTPS